ncbi:hypothetical protein FB451DRAFT_1209057 [Mycena latifolia]|nr:hypothetical protein FB451DRAFT_1209057 [Mycena latifolia]
MTARHSTRISFTSCQGTVVSRLASWALEKATSKTCPARILIPKSKISIVSSVAGFANLRPTRVKGLAAKEPCSLLVIARVGGSAATANEVSHAESMAAFVILSYFSSTKSFSSSESAPRISCCTICKHAAAALRIRTQALTLSAGVLRQKSERRSRCSCVLSVGSGRMWHRLDSSRDATKSASGSRLKRRVCSLNIPAYSTREVSISSRAGGSMAMARRGVLDNRIVIIYCEFTGPRSHPPAQ